MLTLLNRLPEPDQADALVNATIKIDIGAQDTGDTVLLSATQVYIDGTLAFDGGTFQTGYTGPESASSNPQVDTLRVCIDPTLPLPDDQLVTVRVVSDSTIGGDALDESYTFTTEDLTNPVLVSAQAIELDTVRVVFDEAMGTPAADDLQIDLVTGSAQTRLPAVEVVVASVIAVGPTTFDLVTDIALTPDATYDVTAVDVRDEAGNPVLSPGDVERFVAFRPDEPDDRDWDLLGMLPQGNQDEDTTRELEYMTGVMQEISDCILFEIDRWGDILDPDVAPIEFVDAMLADLSCPFDFELSDIDKRRLVKLLVPIYRQKGTNPGIVNAVRFFLGIEVTITEPATGGGLLGVDTIGGTLVLSSSDLGNLLTFCIVSPRALTDDERTSITKIAAYMKRGECHFKISEPSLPVVPDHWELGLSRLGLNTILH